MKKVLKILGLIIVVIYFVGNILPNLIGVPMAFYHSYQASVMENENEYNEEFQEHIITSDSLLKFPKPIGYVNDFENIFTSEQIKELGKKIETYELETTNEIAILTVESIEPYTSIKDYATDLSNEWGVGKAEKDNGLLILFSKSLREIRISTGNGTEKILTDEICKAIIDKTIIPEFKKGDYFRGIEKGLSELMGKWQ